MRVLVIGSNGQLGTELIKILHSGESELGAIPPAYSYADIIGADLDELDISKMECTRGYLLKYRPDIVLNCAAYTNVDGCETHRDEACKANTIGPRNLAIAAELTGAKLLHVSTDYVFAGNGDEPYHEYDLPCPQSVYGATKLAGENYVRELCSKWFIVRTAWLYGYTGKNFVRSIARAAKDKGVVKVVNDQRGNPTNAADLAYHILKIAATEEYGIYHCTGNGECSWYDFAKEIVACAGIDAEVIPCTTNEYGSQTKRPGYSALDHMMLRCTVGDQMRPWQDALKYFFDHDTVEQGE